MSKKTDIRNFINTDRQRIVRYAEVMGWTFWDSLYKQIQHQPCDTYIVSVIGVFVRDEKVAKNNWSRIWNPLTDANDALELAEKLRVRFERQIRRGRGVSYSAWITDREYQGNTLPAAICAAVDAALDKVGHLQEEAGQDRNG